MASIKTINNANRVWGAVWSAQFVIPALTILTIITDLLPAVKNWLTVNFGHQWVGKTILSVIAFLILWIIGTFILAKNNKSTITQSINKLVNITIACVIILFLFFVYEYFK